MWDEGADRCKPNVGQRQGLSYAKEILSIYSAVSAISIMHERDRERQTDHGTVKSIAMGDNTQSYRPQ